jgi:hypothetical protein
MSLQEKRKRNEYGLCPPPSSSSPLERPGEAGVRGGFISGLSPESSLIYIASGRSSGLEFISMPSRFLNSGED